MDKNIFVYKLKNIYKNFSNKEFNILIKVYDTDREQKLMYTFLIFSYICIPFVGPINKIFSKFV